MTGDWTCTRCGTTTATTQHGTPPDPCPIDTVDCDRDRICTTALLGQAVGFHIATGATPADAELLARCDGCPTRPD